jgi:ribosomal protein S18 acetylase RimI-like enzyme
VAEHQNRVIGFAATGPTRDDDESPHETGEVYAIYLQPEFWDRGIGRALFQQAVEELRREGFVRVTLWVLESNARACRFYEAAGMHADGSSKTECIGSRELREIRYRKELL